MAKNKVADKDFNSETGEVTFTFVGSGNVLSVNLADLSDEVKTRLMVHGLHQKVGDSYASYGDAPAEAEDAAISIIEMLKGGDWRAQREKGEARPSLVGRAVFEVKSAKGVLGDGETEQTYIDKYSGKESAALRAKALQNPDVAACVAKYKLQDAQKRAEQASAKAAAAAGGQNADAGSL